MSDDELVADKTAPPATDPTGVPDSTARKADASQDVFPSSPVTGVGPRVPFVWSLPDFVMADPRKLLPPQPLPTAAGGQPITAGLRWLIHSLVIAYGRATIILPDLLLYQAVWGSDQTTWPANRRMVVLKALRSRAAAWGIASIEAIDGDRTCTPACPLHGSGQRHRHVRIAIRTLDPDVSWADLATDGFDKLNGTFLGTLEVFGDGMDDDRTYQWQRKPPAKPTKGTDPEEARELEDEQRRHRLIRQYRQAGLIAATYLPTLVFGASPRVGLSPQQRFLHRAMALELTRVAKGVKTDRVDRAEVIAGGRTAAKGVSAYPDLRPGVRYCGFNGNGSDKYRGRGYALRSWMDRAKYPVPEKDEVAFWKTARAFLADLGVVAEVFGLTVAAWHPKKREWQSLAELPALTRSVIGRRWLSGARVRIYTRDDYLDRWRAWVADRMSFSIIPRPGDEPLADEGQHTAEDGPHTSAAALRAFLSAAGVTQAAFAEAVGASKPEVSKRLNGTLNWTRRWADRVKDCLAKHGEWRGELQNDSL